MNEKKGPVDYVVTKITEVLGSTFEPAAQLVPAAVPSSQDMTLASLDRRLRAARMVH
ncbi:MAG: hypothetical protein KDJ27_20580 [Gammaproteobacteria bacterium]|nr:hypothetical protein [Gammaproteobacteria bacterium]MCB1926098.1 hypothetical protein [Gammaproteobacteria bacterium]